MKIASNQGQFLASNVLRNGLTYVADNILFLSFCIYYISMLLLFGRMYVKFVFNCLTDPYSCFFMHFSRVSENMANSENQSCENNSNNRYVCRQGTRSRGCSVKEEKKVEEALLFSPGTRLFMEY